jgi:hypothetical protein
MNIKNLMKDAKNLTDKEFEGKLNKLVRENYRYKNLNKGNREIILEIIDGYKDMLRKGRSISYDKRYKDLYKLRKNKIKLNLSDEDLKDIKNILDSFR